MRVNFMETLDIEKNVAKKLKQRRKDLGLTQKDLGVAIGITGQQIQKYENGIDRIPASRLFSLGKYLSVPLSFFYKDSEEPADNGKEIFIKCANKRGAFILKLVDVGGIVEQIKILE